MTSSKLWTFTPFAPTYEEIGADASVERMIGRQPRSARAVPLSVTVRRGSSDPVVSGTQSDRRSQYGCWARRTSYVPGARPGNWNQPLASEEVFVTNCPAPSYR